MQHENVPEGLRAQRRPIEKLEAEEFGWDLMIGDAFVRVMRDIGYKNSAFAVAELADNAIQAGATRIDIVFGYDKGSSRPRSRSWTTAMVWSRRWSGRR